MTKKVLFSEAEIAEPSDFDAIGDYMRDADERIVAGAIDYAHHWADVAIATTSAIHLTLSAGSLFAAEKIYANDAPLVVDLQTYLPLVAGDHRFVALLLRGLEETVTANRMVETDADTGATVAQAVPKTSVRRWEVVVQTGLSSPTPVKPSVAATECNLAYIELATTGIVAVEMDHGSRVKSLAEVEGRVTVLEAEMTGAVKRVASIETDIANIAVRLRDIPNPIVIRQMERDISQLRRIVAMPAEARAYWYDDGLLKTEWDTTNASWLARVRDGIRFAWAAERDMQIALLDASSSAIRASGSLVMPAWDEVVRLEVIGDGGSRSISQLTHTVATAIQRTLSRTVVEYGSTTTAGSAASGVAVASFFAEDKSGVIGGGSGSWVSGGAVSRTTVRTVDDVYWDIETEEIGVNGSIYGQTWLCSQPMLLTSIDLFFTRVATDGDVHLFVCACDASGQPQLDAVIASVTKVSADLAAGRVNFALSPTLLESGTRYAWFTVTTGNHALETVSGNKYAQGSLFWCTDGAWAQGDPTVDFAMRLNGARFAATRTVVEMQPATLADGITDMRWLYAGFAPGGTSLTWEILPSDETDWRPITLAAAATDTAWLNGLPALVRQRLVFTGTTDLAPAIVLDATARVMTFRPRGDMRAVSVDVAFGLSTTTVQMDVVVDQFDPAKHTAAPKLVIGATVYTPAATVVTPDLVSAAKRTISATFTVPSTTSARARVDMTTTEVTDLPFIDNIAMYAL